MSIGDTMVSDIVHDHMSIVVLSDLSYAFGIWIGEFGAFVCLCRLILRTAKIKMDENVCFVFAVKASDA
jgi:hypothetical protein